MPFDKEGVFHTTLAPVPASVRAARRAVAQVLTKWNAEPLIDDAVLVTSELVDNAVRFTQKHAPAEPIVLRLHYDGGSPRLEVYDPIAAQPVVRNGDPLDESGRGLNLVIALTAACGYKMVPGGKVVWAKFKNPENGRQ